MSTIVKYSSGSTYTLVPNKVDIEKVQDLDGQYHIPNTSIVGMMRLGLGVQRITVSGDILDMSACLWHDVVAISFDSGTSYQTVYFSGVPYTSDCWSGIYPYALSLLASPLKEQTAVRYPTTGYKWGNQSITGISQAGNVNAYPIIHYLAPLFYAPLSNTLVDFTGQAVTFTRTAAKYHNGVLYPINTPIFDSGLYLASDTAQDVATWTPPATATQVYCLGDSLTFGYPGSTGGYVTRLGTLLGVNSNVINLGISGNQTNQMLARFGDVTEPGDAEYVVIFGGVNDVMHSVSAADIEANLQAMYDAAFSASIKVVAVTITPFKGDASWTSGLQTILDAVNVWILNTAIHVDYRINAYAELEDPATPDALLPAYDNDHLHLSAAGYVALGDAVYAGGMWSLRTIAMQIKMTIPMTGTNLCVNGDFETDIAGWSPGNSVTLSRETALPLVGTGSLKALNTIAGGFEYFVFSSYVVGHVYLISASVKSTAANGRLCRFEISNGGTATGASTDASAGATINMTFTATGTTAYPYIVLTSGIAGESLLIDTVRLYDLTARPLTVWTAANNKIYVDLANKFLVWTDDTTIVSLALPASFLTGTVMDLVVRDGASHAVNIAAHTTNESWTSATGTLAALAWPQLTLGNLEGSIANLIEYPYVLTDTECIALSCSSLSLLFNTLFVGNKYAGEIIKGSDKRLVNTNGSDISALLGGTDIPIGATPVTIAQSQGLSARWYVEVKRTDV